MNRLLPLGLSLLFMLLGTACGEERPERERCPQCGMFVDLAPRWNAGLVDGSGSPRVFDSPKCMMRWAAAESGSGSRDAWVVEYYDQERRPMANVVLVMGSDVIGPMGADLVPVAPGESAERFITDHGGRVVAPGDVDADVLREVDGP